MEKVPCDACGVQILPQTWKENQGLCMPCARGNTTTCVVCGKRAFRSMRGIATGDLCSECRKEQERLRPTVIRQYISEHRLSGCELLARLFELEQELRSRGGFPWPGLDLIDPPEHYGTAQTPKNTIAFARTGGDDVHFSFVTSRGRISDESPVVVTIPDASTDPWECNLIVGGSLRDFLSLGCQSGFDPVADLSYGWDEAVDELAHPEGSELDEDDADTLTELRTRLALEPWGHIGERLCSLQQRKRFVLRFRSSIVRWFIKRRDE